MKATLYATDTSSILDTVVSEAMAGRTLGSLLAEAKRQDPKNVSTPADVYALCHHMGKRVTECLMGLYLDAQNRLLVRTRISTGSLNTTRTHPREIMLPAILHHAVGFILVHNHPSGTLVPSIDDIEFTKAIGRAGELMGIPLYDHVIVSRNGFISLKEKGLL